MKILFIGNYVDDRVVDDVRNVSLAANKFQYNIIHSLRKKYTCHLVSFVAYKTDESLYNKIENLSDNENFYFSKGQSTLKNIIKFRKKIKSIINEYDIVISHNSVYPWLFINHYINKKTKTVLLLTDFSDTNSYKNILYKLYATICKIDIKKYNYVVGLSSYTKRYLKQDQKFILVHGGINFDLCHTSNLTEKGKIFKFMYSGSFGLAAGVDLLIEAFKNFSKSDNVELILTGKCNDINKFSDNELINYKGVLSYEEYINCLNECNVLINPRNMNLPENQNNFPSKIFDYLLTGKIVVSTKFSDYNDFSENFIFCDSNSQDLYLKMKYVKDNYDNLYEEYYNYNIEKTKI